MPTVIEPLRAEWEQVKEAALAAVMRGEYPAAIKGIELFHHQLGEISTLDPASGPGNFLAVTLNLLSDLEGEVVQARRDLGQTDREIAASAGIRPSQFRGIESVPLAAAVSEVVVRIAVLQRHFKTYVNVPPPESITRGFSTIECRDAVLTWNGDTSRPASDWPQADFIVGNPPFIRNSKMRRALGDRYVEGLRTAYPDVAGTVDYALYWWHRAAQLVREGKTRRFGFITSRTINQPRNRVVLERHMQAEPPLSIVWAIADHPWHDPVSQAQVRIAMTVGCAGNEDGVLMNVKRDGTPTHAASGKINANLTIGVDVSTAKPLKANEGIASLGVTVNGSGFIISPELAAQLGLGTVPGLEQHIRPYMNGRDLAGTSREKMVIDLFGLNESEVKERFPTLYEHIMQHVKPARDKNSDDELKDRWWLFQRTRPELRMALQNIYRFIATPGVARCRYFVFMDAKILPDTQIVAVANDDACVLDILSSRIHQIWALAAGGRKGAGGDPVYIKTRCFDTFPFPEATEAQKTHIRDIAEQLDAHRRTQQAAFPKLTLTAMYGVLDKQRSGEPLSAKDLKIVEQAGLQELQRLHDELDVAVADAYGWSVDLDEQEVLKRLLELNNKNTNKYMQYDHNKQECIRANYGRGFVITLEQGAYGSAALLAKMCVKGTLNNDESSVNADIIDLFILTNQQVKIQIDVSTNGKLIQSEHPKI